MTAALPDLSTVAGETSLTPFVLPIWFWRWTSRGSLAVVFRNCSCWSACFSCLVGGCEETCCSASEEAWSGGTPWASSCCSVCWTACCSCCCCWVELFELLLVVWALCCRSRRRSAAGRWCPGRSPRRSGRMPGGRSWTWASAPLSAGPSWRLSTGIGQHEQDATATSIAGTDRSRRRAPSAPSRGVGDRRGAAAGSGPAGSRCARRGRQQRGQQRDRREHRDQDHDRGGVAQRADERDLAQRPARRARSRRCRPRTRPRRPRWPSARAADSSHLDALLHEALWRVTMNSA